MKKRPTLFARTFFYMAVLSLEVRALRAELLQTAKAGIRMQLLVARLQLQEQRVLMAGRQLLEVQNALAAVRQELTGEQARDEQLEKSPLRSTGQAQLQQVILESRAQIEQLQKREQHLQARETESLKTVNDAQAQWMDFSERLDALERTVNLLPKSER